MKLVALYCPGCGAPVNPGEACRVTCGYCGCALEVRGRDTVVQTEASDTQAHALDLDDLPLASLFSTQTGRFELSILQQEIPGTIDDGFFPLPLPEGRFALVYLRLIDSNDKTIKGDLDELCQLVKANLEDEEDPGLAAYHALEYLAETAYEGRLEVAIMLFSPAQSSVVAYNAGCPNSLWWVSSEEGRVIDSFRSYPPLEKKMLRQASDHFSNCEPCYLAANDLAIAVSATCVGRGGGPYCDGTRSLLQSLDANLGEHPLRIVTLAKNSYWEGLSPSGKEQPPSGPIRVAAVRAMAPSEPEQATPLEKIQRFEIENFEVALHARPQDSLIVHPLHDARHCIIWLEAGQLNEADVQGMTEAILAVLDRPEHGDNENPREAGRRALQQLGRPCRLLVLQLFPRWGRAKWFRSGWHQPLCLGPRGLKDPASAQTFDEGGESSVYERARLFFTGALPLKAQASTAGELAQQWYGGKASALYGALFAHWRTTKTDRALEKLLRAAHADRPDADLFGTALLTRIGP